MEEVNFHIKDIENSSNKIIGGNLPNMGSNFYIDPKGPQSTK